MGSLGPRGCGARGASVVVGLGEILWDVFDDGERFGGAPANFACHAAAFGAEACMVGAVGADDRGQRALKALQDHGVSTEAVVVVPEVPTGNVRIRVGALGTPEFEIPEDVAWDRVPWTQTMERLARRTDAVCFGTFVQRSATTRRTLRRFLQTTSTTCLRVFDVNLRQDEVDVDVIGWALERSSVLKLNEVELAVVAGIAGVKRGEIESGMAHLLRRYPLQCVLVTLGDRGAIVMDRARTVSVRSEPTEVVDAVGAGDAFTATITMGLLMGREASDLAAHACRVAAFVCGHAGAVPDLPSSLYELPTMRSEVVGPQGAGPAREEK